MGTQGEHRRTGGDPSGGPGGAESDGVQLPTGVEGAQARGDNDRGAGVCAGAGRRGRGRVGTHGGITEGSVGRGETIGSMVKIYISRLIHRG